MNRRTANNHRRARERWEREGYWRRKGVVTFVVRFRDLDRGWLTRRIVAVNP